jgi:tetratricopeptide (TPR) repeat protein
VLAARLDRLDVPQRGVIERAAVIGEEFWRGAVSELSPAESREAVPAQLEALIAKELLRRGVSPLPGEEAFRFSHLLVREVAYAGLLKELRAELHERFADWLEQRAGEHAEIIGYHLERAYRYRTELGLVDKHAQTLARRAGLLLGAAGMRAEARGDSAALELLGRAISLLPPSDPARPEFVLTHGSALGETGEVDRALQLLDEAADTASVVGDRRVELLAPLWTAAIRFDGGQADTTAELRKRGEAAVARLADLGDDLGLSVAHAMLGRADIIALRLESAAASFERALVLAGGRTRSAQSTQGYSASLLLGPLPVETAIRRLEELKLGGGLPGEPSFRPAVASREGEVSFAVREIEGVGIASLEAMRGNFERARQLCRQTEAYYMEVGQLLLAAGVPGFVRGPLEMMAGDLETAQRELQRSVELMRELGQHAHVSSILPELAQVLFAEGRFEEAEAASLEARDATSPSDVFSRITWRAIHAKLLAERGKIEEAQSLAREAVSIAARTDALSLHARALLDLAYVLNAGDLKEEAKAAGVEARERYEAKGNLVGVRSAVAFLERC